MIIPLETNESLKNYNLSFGKQQKSILQYNKIFLDEKG